ncbi:MAG TPA: glutaredoxin family protein [Burkholderiaceae bacterium]|nr:glutaredoxin family protein [Burkholderiaceae bacterium]
MPRPRNLLSLVAIVAVVLCGAEAVRHFHDRSLAQRLAAAGPGEIVMYSTTECPYCAKARDWFDRHGVIFTECNLSVSEVCRQAFARLGAVGVPTFVVDGKTRSGFDPQWIATALGR